MSGLRMEDNAVAAIRNGWNADLQEESQEFDVLTALTGVYNEKLRTVPNGIIMDVDMKGINSMTLSLLMDLTAAGTQGDGTVTTEAQVIKFISLYAANVRHGVTNDMFGREAEIQSFYDMIGRANSQIGKWMAARMGKHLRQAMLEKNSDNLEVTPHSLTSGWNRHFVIKNLTDAQQPAYSATLNTYTSNLYSAFGTAGTTSSAVSTAGFFNKLAYYATAVFKLGAQDDGTYIALVPSRQKQHLVNLSDTASLSSLQRTALSDKYVNMAFGGVMGALGPIILVEDFRNPILVRDTSGSTLTAYYRDVGATDDRTSYSNAGTTTVYDAIPILGKGGVVRGRMMDLRYDDELSDVGKVRQLVASQTYGCQVAEYDADTASATSRIGQNMMIGAAYSGSITT